MKYLGTDREVRVGDVVGISLSYRYEVLGVYDSVDPGFGPRVRLRFLDRETGEPHDFDWVVLAGPGHLFLSSGNETTFSDLAEMLHDRESEILQVRGELSTLKAAQKDVAALQVQIRSLEETNVDLLKDLKASGTNITEKTRQDLVAKVVKFLRDFSQEVNLGQASVVIHELADLVNQRAYEPGTAQHVTKLAHAVEKLAGDIGYRNGKMDAENER